MGETILIYEVKWLPMELANKVWRWQYLKRKSVARFFKTRARRIECSINKPRLYKIDSCYE